MHSCWQGSCEASHSLGPSPMLLPCRHSGATSATPIVSPELHCMKSTAHGFVLVKCCLLSYCVFFLPWLHEEGRELAPASFGPKAQGNQLSWTCLLVKWTLHHCPTFFNSPSCFWFYQQQPDDKILTSSNAVSPQTGEKRFDLRSIKT